MRIAAAAALVALAVASGAVVSLAAAPAVAPAPARLQVVSKEFFFILSRRSVVAGPAIVEVVNFGEDPHDLRIQRVGGAHIAGTPEVLPGGTFERSLTLRAGRYRLWCSIADHRRRGMQAVLTVVAKKKQTKK